jgi:hypothetical protein
MIASTTDQSIGMLQHGELGTHALGKHSSFDDDASHQSPKIDHPESLHQPLAKTHHAHVSSHW